MHKCLLAVVVWFGCAHTTEVQGQTLSPVTLEMSAGLVRGNTTPVYRFNTGLAVDLLTGVLLKETAAWNVVAGVSLVSQGVGGVDDKCVLSPTGGCKESFPHLSMLSALAGLETRGGSARVLTGPTYVTDVAGDPNVHESTLGWELRGNAFVRLFFHTSLGIQVRGALVPKSDRAILGLVTGALVLRLR